MPISDYRLGDQLLGVENCPHCGVSSPLLRSVWTSNEATPRTDGGRSRRWAAFACTTCGGVVSVECVPSEVSNPHVVAMYPSIWGAHSSMPEQARNYLNQARRTLSSPDASVVMSASSIDAMLKDNNLIGGTLNKRINQAVHQGIITQGMAEWAHRVRLDANNPRHADLDNPHMTIDDAYRAFDFAKALAEILYALPSRMPPAEEPD